ncbi:MAG: ParB/RepB/Spo0J family partition protein [Treponema sp.]|nr:ParB/RepB/Spo0J family partition protein [Treponema sp.]
MPKKEKLVLEDLPISQIDPNPDNSSLFSMDSVDHLAKIIDEEGFTTPIEVFKKKDGRYEITSGHRRYEAMKVLKQKTIPCYITSGYDSDTKKDRKLISSNIASRRLTPLEMARAIKLYKEILSKEKFKGDKRKKVAEYFNISESNVYRYECLLKLIPELQEFCNRPLFPYSCLREAAGLTKEEQKQLYDELISIEASMKNVAPDEIDKDEIVFSRTRIEQIINGKIRQKENALKKEQQEEEEDVFPMNEPEEETTEEVDFQILSDDEDEVVNFDEYVKSESINESINLAGLDQCIVTVKEYAKSSTSVSDKKALKSKIDELKKEIAKLENSL